jgi:AcrR family transcriptional regulator
MPTVDPPVSRRERLREELITQIVAIGRRQLEEAGMAGVSWRGIAREVGMNPASLYTYVDGIDDLYTRILIESFDALAAAVRAASEASRDQPARQRILDCAAAYREWAVAHPHQFNLIFTDQIPGYEAPPGGPTVDAEIAVEEPFIDAVAELLGRTPDDLLADTTSRVFAAIVALRSQLLGFTMLEINHHAPYLDDSPTIMLTATEHAIDALLAIAST